MLIRKLKLSKYTRLKLNNIKEITITPTENIILILGSNGSGKSSLIKELSPIPGDFNDYELGGSKEIIISHNNSEYKLLNIFDKVCKYSFIKDDVELNPGGTITTFKEIVNQEFRITQQIHNLLVDADMFHNMSPTIRREWFTLLSNINYDYILGLYKKLSIEKRDLDGVIKNIKNKLVTESAKLNTPNDIINLKNNIDSLNTNIDYLKLFLVNDVPDKDIIKNNINTLITNLYNISKGYLKLNINKPKSNYSNIDINSLEDIDIYIDKLNSLSIANDAILNKDLEELTKLTNIQNILKQADNESIDKYKTDLNNNLETISKLRVNHLFNFVPDNIEHLLSVIDTVIINTSEIVFDAPVYSELYSNESQTKINNDLINKTNLLVNLNKNISIIETKINHINNHRDNKEATCPKCNHTFIFDKNIDTVDNLVKEKEVTNIKIKETEADIENCKSLLSTIATYNDIVFRYKNILRMLNDSNIINYISTNKYFYNSPNYVPTVFGQYKEYLLNLREANKLEEKNKELENIINNLKTIGSADSKNIVINIENLNNNITKLTKIKQELNVDLNNAKNYKTLINNALSTQSNIVNIYNSVIEETQHYEEAELNYLITTSINSLQIDLGLKLNSLRDSNKQQDLVEVYNKELIEATNRNEHLTELLNILSPKNGMIGESLINNINIIIDNINKVITKVWKYPLEIQYCFIDDNNSFDLNYKFPVKVKDNIISDIKEGSKSIIEIINLAFKLIVMDNLNLKNYPMYLDEFSSSFDKEHRRNGVELIKELANNECSQLFLVSHYDSIYSAFNNCNIIVLDDSNITIPTSKLISGCCEMK